MVPDLYIAWHAGKSSWKNYKSLNQIKTNPTIHTLRATTNGNFGTLLAIFESRSRNIAHVNDPNRVRKSPRNRSSVVVLSAYSYST